MVGAHVREVQRVPELVQEGLPVGLAAVRTKYEVHLVRHAHGRAEGARALPLPLARVEAHASPRLRVDAHLAHLSPDRRLHLGGREVPVELARAEQCQRVGTRRLARMHAEDALHERGAHLVPHRLRVAQELRALVAQRAERNAVEQLPGGVVAVRQAQRLGDVALALEPFTLHRRELLLHQRVQLVDGQ